MAYVVPMLAALDKGLGTQDTANYNAHVAQQEGRNASLQAGNAEAIQRIQGREFLGRQAAAIAQSGVGPGSASLVQQQSATQVEMDALNTRYKGILTKYGYDVEAKNMIRAGKDAAIGGVLNAGASFLTGTAGPGYGDTLGGGYGGLGAGGGTMPSYGGARNA